MARKVKVEICVPCYGNQSPRWWAGVMGNLLADSQSVEFTRVSVSATMLPDHNKNTIIGPVKHRDTLTDTNRNNLTSGFLGGDADYSYWLDDDTMPPYGALGSLLKMQREFASGLYFLPKEPYTPIAYMRNKDGQYAAINQYAKGSIFQVDSVGMGCALIHRSVFEKIAENHVVVKRHDGASYPIHKDRVINGLSYAGDEKQPWLEDGVLHTPVRIQADSEFEDKPWPFFILDSQRTEDHFFCEMAASVGIAPWLDTSVVCDHIKMQATNEAQFRKYEKEHKK